MVKFYFYFITFFISISTYSQTIHQVSSLTEFDNSINNTSPGDIIEWIDGNYSDIFMEIPSSVNNITIQAQTAGSVIFDGASRARINGDNITFTGFQYIGGNILDGSTSVIQQTIITIDGSNTQVTDINFSNYSCYKYMRIRDDSQFTTVSNCNFENRANYEDQNIFQIDVSEEQPGFHTIRFCSFKNFTGDPNNVTNGDDGVEPIRTGSSEQSARSCKTVVEYCYFTSCNGDDEVISGKATDCIYRYNTLESNNGEIVLRHGDAGIVYGNFFINNESGVRVREGSNHIIYNNYFSGLTDNSINLQASPDDDKRGVVRVQDVIIAHNTFVATDNIDLGDNDPINDPLNTVFINNLFENTTSSNHFRSATGTETWFGNIIDDEGDLGISPTPSSGITFENPNLVLNNSGFYELPSTSPAIDAAVNNTAAFPFPLLTGLPYDNEILLDVLLTDRPSLATSKDVGAQEYDASVVIEPHVTADNTGPSYLMPIDPALSTVDFIQNLGSDLIFYPNPIDEEITLSFNFNMNTTITIEIYDPAGTKIRTLINDSFNSGINTINKSIDLSTGVYFMTINVKDSSGRSTSKTEKLLKL